MIESGSRLSLRNPVHLLAVGFGSGLAPWAPGTFGTLAAVPLFWLLNSLGPLTYLSFLVVGTLLGVWLCGRTARDLHVHDDPRIVWDEIMGYLLAMVAAPAGWVWPLLGFVLFRLFDIWKPWPVGALERGVPGAFGVMVDDLAAGAMALAVLQFTLLAFQNI